MRCGTLKTFVASGSVQDKSTRVEINAPHIYQMSIETEKSSCLI